MIEYRNQWLDIFIGAIALYLGGPAMQHRLAYYRYPICAVSLSLSQNLDSNKDERLEMSGWNRSILTHKIIPL
jgi:hypothetical protein